MSCRGVNMIVAQNPIMEADQNNIIKQGYFESENVVLAGVICLKSFYGPPNFGETPEMDRTENFYVLVLENYIIVNNNGIETKIQELQLISSGDFLEELDLDKIYTVEENIIEAQSGHHHTKYVFLVISEK
jgi:hypothetical protein